MFLAVYDLGFKKCELDSNQHEIMAEKTSCEEAISIRYMLRCLGVRIERSTILYDDNQGILQSSTLINSEYKKKHTSIAYHKMWECIAAGIVNPVKVATKINLSDFLMKGTAWKTDHFLTDGKVYIMEVEFSHVRGSNFVCLVICSQCRL